MARKPVVESVRMKVRTLSGLTMDMDANIPGAIKALFSTLDAERRVDVLKLLAQDHADLLNPALQ